MHLALLPLLFPFAAPQRHVAPDPSVTEPTPLRGESSARRSHRDPMRAEEVELDLRGHLQRHRRAEAEAKRLRMARWAVPSAPMTANQLAYDVLGYDLDLTLTPGSKLLSGTVTTTARIVGSSLSTLELDLDGNMSVSGTTSAGTPVSATHASDLLTVTLDRTYATGETVVVAVSYSGDPEGGSFGWDSHAGSEMIWTLSEPYGAREWWPCKDVNVDKADSVDIRVTVPDHLTVASNGLLVSNTAAGGSRTFHWHTDYAIPTYLVSLAIFPYTTFSHWYTPLAGGGPMEVQYYVYPDNYSAVQSTYALVVPMLQTFAAAFGEYPFVDEKYGHAEFEWGGGMEHQTLSSMGGYSEDLISHELAHQWFGDQITCADFGHIWLNEGFATWSEAYWKEQTSGFSTYQAYMDASAYFGGGTIFVEDPTNFGEIFEYDLTYAKASWVPHMLRHVVGDASFFAGLAQYRASHGYGTATTEQFRDAMELASGMDLDAFFNEWIYGEYFPKYRFSWTQTGSTVDLTIEQVQTNTGLFTLPIDVAVTTSTGTYDFVVQNQLASQDYQLTVPGTAQDVALDPDKWILKQIETTVSNPTFDQGVLLVNGVDWNTYGSEISSAYQSKAFWGESPITFWDCFDPPAGGYPSTLPAPIGHDSVPGGVLGRYSAVIWVGNDYNGDLADWQSTPIQSYLDAGGNVLLMTRRSQGFFDAQLTSYLGVSWTSSGLTLSNCTSQYAGLASIPFTGTQSWNDAFSTGVAPHSTLLFRDTGGGNRGVGVHAHPPGGGSSRPDGGRFVLLCGRPYRMGHSELRTNVEFILDHFFGEPYAPPRLGPRRALFEGPVKSAF